MSDIDIYAAGEKFKAFTSSPNGQNGDLRLSWKLGPNNQQGHGEWFPSKERTLLMSHVDWMNKKYGVGTHWLEEHA